RGGQRTTRGYVSHEQRPAGGSAQGQTVPAKSVRAYVSAILSIVGVAPGLQLSGAIFDAQEISLGVIRRFSMS
ncbi:MAG TPA: hypothetical protein VGZ25_00535, partial [Gemmataceae bacterium]|nr:hypothetical protein [Gemmataceae bacterium]